MLLRGDLEFEYCFSICECWEWVLLKNDNIIFWVIFFLNLYNNKWSCYHTLIRWKHKFSFRPLLKGTRLYILNPFFSEFILKIGFTNILYNHIYIVLTGAADPNFFPTTSSLPYGGITRTTLLRKAVYWGFKEAVSLLLAAGSDPNQDISCPPSVIPDKTAKMLENRESCKMMVEEAKVNRPSLLKLKNHCWNVVSGLLYSSWKARSACTESKKRDDDYEMNLLKLYH